MKFSKLSAYKTKKILELFSKDINASTAAKLLDINRNTLNRYYNLFRGAIFSESLVLLEMELGIFEANETYFGATRVRGLGGGGAAGKMPVFGLLKRGEGPECDDFDETVCHFSLEGDGVLEKYRDFGITEAQYQVLLKFRDEFRNFYRENSWPPEFIDSPEWTKITEMAKDVLKAFHSSKTETE